MATVTAGYNWVSGETVTPAKLNSAAAPTVALTAEERTPAGAVMAFAMNSAPTGWLAADGTAVSRSTYASLFSAIGTTYGVGDGSTTFALPDLRGYFVRGVGVAGQNGANSDGTVSGTFGAKQAHAFESHRHFVMSNGSGVAISDGNQTMQMIGNQGDNPFSYQLFGTTSLTAQANTGPTSSTGGTETRPANIAMLYCIKF
jgi:microcystin-dependent protein